MLPLVLAGLVVSVAFVSWRARPQRWLSSAQQTSVDTMMQDPTEWLDREVILEGVLVPGSANVAMLGCSYRLREGWKSVEVRGRSCGGAWERHGRQVYTRGKLRRSEGAFFFEGQEMWWSEPVESWRYLPPELPLGLTEQAVAAQASAFRQRVAARAPGDESPDSVRVLRKGFMHGCFLRFSGTVGCWHNHQWGRERQNTPSSLFWVHEGPSLTSLELDAYSGAGLAANGEVYWFSVPRTESTDSGEIPVPNASPGRALRVDIPKAKSVRLGSDACAVLENGNVACWDWNGSPSEKPALVPHAEEIVGACHVGRDEIVCPPNERLARKDVDALVESNGTLYSHLCLLRKGALSCRGSNWFGELGVPRFSTDRRDSDEWVPVATSEPVLQVAAGGRHTCAKLSSGWVECWGANEFGQSSPFALVMSSARPQRVARFPIDWELSAHQDLTCMSRAGAFECWGNCGQLPVIPGVVCTTWDATVPAPQTP